MNSFILTPRSLACAFCAVLSAILLMACSQSETAVPAEPSASPKTVLTVELVSPRERLWSDVIEASGPIAAWQEASIGAELGGIRLEKVLVNVGDRVSRGQILARFSEESLKAELDRLEAQIAERQAAVEKARLDAASADQMEPTGALSKQEIRTVRTQARIAEAQLVSAQAARDAQALRLRYAEVRAPDDGVISARTATVGAVSAPGAELFRLIRGGRLEWRAEVRADALRQLRPGTRAVLRLPQGSTVAGTVRQIAPTVNAETQTGIVYVDLPRGLAVPAGLFISGKFDLPSAQALVVPVSAVVFRRGAHFVMQVAADHRVHEVKVEPGRLNGNDIELVKGPGTDAHLVLSGGEFLEDGDRVATAEAIKAPQE